MRRLGVDVGGTFTDLLIVDEEAGTVSVEKVPTTPDPAEGVLTGTLSVIEAAGLQPGDVGDYLHGTTIATNIVLEHDGARGGLITTARLPGHPPHRPPPAPADVLDLPGGPVAGPSADPARAADDRAGARDRARRRGGDAARRGRGARGGPRAGEAGRGGRGGLLPVLVPQPRPRAARGGDPGRGAARRVRVPAQRRGPALPRVRGVLHHRAVRVRGAEDEPLHPAPLRQPGERRHQERAARDDLGGRRGHRRGRHPPAGQPADVRSGGRADGRPLGRQAVRATRR